MEIRDLNDARKLDAAIWDRMEALVRDMAGRKTDPGGCLDITAMLHEADEIVALLPEPVDADLLEAREICAQCAAALNGDDEPDVWVDEYRRGIYDQDREVQYTLAAIKRLRGARYA